MERIKTLNPLSTESPHFSISVFNRSGLECFICREISLERGKLDCCEHYFCLICIVKWAHNVNTCPLCRKIFKSIVVIVSRTFLKTHHQKKEKEFLKQFYKVSTVEGYIYMR